VIVVITTYAVSFFNKKFKRRYIDNSNVLLFTWYYALKELNVADEELFK
jgi:hypothetical protein